MASRAVELFSAERGATPPLARTCGWRGSRHGSTACVTSSELRACGLTPEAIARPRPQRPAAPDAPRASMRSVTRTRPGTGGYLAAVKACGAGAVLSHWSAARAPEHHRVGGQVPGRARARRRALRSTRGSRGIAPPTCRASTSPRCAGFRSRRPSARCSTSPACCRAHRLRRAVRQAQFLKLTTVGSLVGGAARPGPDARPQEARPHHRHRRRPDPERARGRRAGSASCAAASPIPSSMSRCTSTGRRIVPDFRWPEQRLVIEADGPHHDDPLERAADRERQRDPRGRTATACCASPGSRRSPHPAATLRRIDEAGAPRAVD